MSENILTIKNVSKSFPKVIANKNVSFNVKKNTAMNSILKNSKITIHFIGIGGIGMSGIAELMLDQGFIIQGSDLHINENIKRLKKKGQKYF